VSFPIVLTVIVALTMAASASAQQAGHRGHDLSSSLFSPREASGTSWVPDASPMYAAHWEKGSWRTMFHGVAFAQALFESGDIHRTGGFSARQFSALNWGMFAARRRAGAGVVGWRTMISVETFTVPGCGYLSILASGEMCDGDTIHDRQHAHDAVMELAADYDRPLRGSLRWQLYAGLSGEPALGPPGYPHRPSSAANPTAPISHHWLDSTHVTFGLVTTGVYQPRWKAEMSVFNGREPDENRLDFDVGRFDSVSGRFTIMATPNLALQVSAGQLHDAEQEFAPEPRTDVFRATASASYHHTFTNGRMLDVTLAVGLNSGREVIPIGSVDLTTAAGLIEGTLTIRDRHVFFARGELVGKPAHDLHAHEYADRVFPVGKLQVGYTRYFTGTKGVQIGIGGTGSLALTGPELAPRYQNGVAPGAGVFATIRPARHGR
jgi:hypothetical protein